MTERDWMKYALELQEKYKGLEAERDELQTKLKKVFKHCRKWYKGHLGEMEAINRVRKVFLEGGREI